MTTVVRRTFGSTPQRDAVSTWQAIIALLCNASSTDARQELNSVLGIAAAIITDKAPQDAPIVVTCEGPRTRIYCVYDENAIDGTDIDENSLGFDPLKGAWSISLPCEADDLVWVEKALKSKSARITARDKSKTIATAGESSAEAYVGLTLDPKGFLAP